MERGSDKHGPRLDDQLAHEVEGAMRGGHSTHAQEWKDPEPSGEDQPDVDLVPDGTASGGVPAGMSEAAVELRSEVAARLGKEIWPATGAELGDEAVRNQAPDHVLHLMEHLEPGRVYTNLQEAWSDLGGGSEQRRA